MAHLNPKNILLIMKKELLGLSDEKTIIFAILLQLFVALFASVLLIGLTSIYDPESMNRYQGINFNIAYIGNESQLYSLLANERGLRIYPMDLSSALTSLKERKISGVLFVPDIAPESDKPVTLTLYLIKNDITSALVEMRLKTVLNNFEEILREKRASYRIADPIVVLFPEDTSGNSTFFEFIYGLLIPLLVLMPVIVSSALVIDLITEEFQYETLETLLSTPVSLLEIILGKVAICIIIVPLQAFIWLLLLMLNHIQILSLPQILLTASILAIIFVELGAITALIFRERSQAQFIFSTGVVAVILMMISVPGNPLNSIALYASSGGFLLNISFLLLLVMVAALLSFILIYLTLGFQRILIKKRNKRS